MNLKEAHKVIRLVNSRVSRLGDGATCHEGHYGCSYKERGPCFGEACAVVDAEEDSRKKKNVKGEES